MNEEQTVGTLYGVGVGPGDPGLLTMRAVEVLRKVDVIFHVAGPRSRTSISERIVASVEGRNARMEKLVFSMSTDTDERKRSVREAAQKVARALETGADCAFATIGDPLVYSTFSYLQRIVRELLPAVNICVIPGITAFQAAAAARGEPLVENNEVLTVIPRWQGPERLAAAMKDADTAVLLKTYRHRQDALDAVQSVMPDADLLYAARVGMSDEVLETSTEGISEHAIDYLSLLIAKRRTHD